MLSLLATISVRPRQSWLVALCALAALLLGLSEPALAQTCSGILTVECTAGTYNSAINVSADPAQAISITLDPNVIVNIPAGLGGVNAVNAANSTGVSIGSSDIAITADGTRLIPLSQAHLYVADAPV